MSFGWLFCFLYIANTSRGQEEYFCFLNGTLLACNYISYLTMICQWSPCTTLPTHPFSQNSIFTIEYFIHRNALCMHCKCIFCWRMRRCCFVARLSFSLWSCLPATGHIEGKESLLIFSYWHCYFLVAMFMQCPQLDTLVIYVTIFVCCNYLSH